MAVSPELRDHVLDLLEGLGPVTSKSMFGGVGLSLDGVMFAILTRADVLYMRTDDSNRGEFEAAGMEPFVPFTDGRMTMPYHQAPSEVLEDADAMCAWARSAWDAAKRARAKGPGKGKGKGKGTDKGKEGDAGKTRKKAATKRRPAAS